MIWRTTALVRALALVAMIVAVATACDSGTVTSGPSSEPPSSPGYISVAPTVQKDSIEDVNSTKDMTGVVTTYSGDNNPYFHLIPYVCPFIPDSVVKSLGASTKSTGFGGQHKLLQTCNISTTRSIIEPKPGYTVSIQAVSLAEVLQSDGRKILQRDIPLAGGVVGYSYKLDVDDSESSQGCNVVWGTFYGTGVVSVDAPRQSAPDACLLASRFARTVLPLLPRTPSQMRPKE